MSSRQQIQVIGLLAALSLHLLLALPARIAESQSPPQPVPNIHPFACVRDRRA